MFMRVPSRRIAGYFIGFNLIIVLCFMLVSWWNSPPDYVFKHPYFFFDIDIEEPRSVEQKCVLPRLHPFHPSIWHYLKFQKDVTCKKKQPDFTYINSSGHLVFNETELKDNSYVVEKTLFCVWCPVLRDGDEQLSFRKDIKVPIEGSKLPPDTEIIRVQCRNFIGILIYEKFEAHVPVAKTRSTTSPKHPINVLIFGLDSLSRLAFIRHLPRTYRYLTEELNMTVLRGMNKVGDNTFPNLIPLLTGHKAYGDELGDTSQYYDDWPLIWRNFSSIGYGTLWAEDLIAFGLFNYLAKGFHEPPVDYYMRPYWLALENSSLMKRSSYMCYGSIPKYFLQCDYLRRFINTYEKANKPYFAFSFLAELTHDYTTRIASSDSYFENFFKSLYTDGYLKNTIMLVMSDHGHRFDSIRTTQVGHIEESLPFFSIHIPDSLSMIQPAAKEILQQNSGRLVTPYDTYETLMDLFHLFAFNRPLGQSKSVWNRGQTLFRKVPADRTCTDASIPVVYCSCQTDSDISLSDPRVKTAADTTLWTINEMVKKSGEDLCAERTLVAVKSAHLVSMAEKSDESVDNVRVIIETEPGGVFEALISLSDGAAVVLGEISRINSYKSESHCIKHMILRKFCYCKDLLDKKNS